MLSSIPSLVSIVLLLKSYNQIIYTPILREESVSISVPVEETQVNSMPVEETQVNSIPFEETQVKETPLTSPPLKQTTHPPGKTHSLLTCFLSTGITWLLYDFNVRREALRDA